MSISPFPQVEQAVQEMIQKILTQTTERLFLLMAPMQSGKTQFIEDMYIEFRKHFPNCMGLYVVSHNHKDFISQNFCRLEHLQCFDLHCLTLRERRLGKVKDRPLKSFANDPVIIFFDENHFGDGVYQTIDNWLRFNNLRPGKNVYMIGVSATPFSSIYAASESTVCYDPRLMPSYKSISLMLDRGDVVEATPIIKKNKGVLEILWNAPALLHLDHLIKTEDSGTAIIRVSTKEQGVFLEKELVKKYSKDKLFVRHWNQDNQIDNPTTFFSARRNHLFTVVIVQQKGRMGTTFKTDFIKMVYDFCPRAAVATVAQGLPGRCCGHEKINDQVKVFSHLEQLEAYSLFERGLFDEFNEYLSEHDLKSSQRSHVARVKDETHYVEVMESIVLDKDAIKKQVKDFLVVKHGPMPLFDSTIVRTLSENKKEKEGSWYENIIDRPLDKAGIKKLSRDPGKVAILIDDRAIPCRIFAGYRFENSAALTKLVARPTSIFADLGQQEIINL